MNAHFHQSQQKVVACLIFLCLQDEHISHRPLQERNDTSYPPFPCFHSPNSFFFLFIHTIILSVYFIITSPSFAKGNKGELCCCQIKFYGKLLIFTGRPAVSPFLTSFSGTGSISDKLYSEIHMKKSCCHSLLLFFTPLWNSYFVLLKIQITQYCCYMIVTFSGICFC